MLPEKGTGGRSFSGLFPVLFLWVRAGGTLYGLEFPLLCFSGKLQALDAPLDAARCPPPFALIPAPLLFQLWWVWAPKEGRELSEPHWQPLGCASPGTGRCLAPLQGWGCRSPSLQGIPGCRSSSPAARGRKDVFYRSESLLFEFLLWRLISSQNQHGR